MQVIICGGRDYTFTPEDVAWLDALWQDHDITTLLHGDAPGADTQAKWWGMTRGLAVRAFPAHWAQEGLAAGPRRNARMLSALRTSAAGDPCAVIAFPGGKGTADMMAKARKAGVPIWRRESCPP